MHAFGRAGVLILSSMSFGFTSSPPAQDSLEHARQVIAVAYPDLAAPGSKASLQLSTNQPWSGRIGAMHILLTGPKRRDDSEAELVVTYGSDEHGRLAMFLASGNYVSTERREQLRKVIDARGLDHPAISRLLAQHGARFGPTRDGAVAGDLRVGDYAKVLGPFDIISTRFAYRQEATEPSDRTVTMLWQVIARPQQTEAEELHFAFEPFEGKLVGIWRVPQQ